MAEEQQFIDSLIDLAEGALELRAPASAEVIAATEEQVGELPVALKDLLRVSNGFVCGRFRLLSCFDAANPKKSWESIERAQLEMFAPDSEHFGLFVCFADIGQGLAMLERATGAVWYSREETRDEMHETDFGLWEFIEAAVNDPEQRGGA